MAALLVVFPLSFETTSPLKKHNLVQDINCHLQQFMLGPDPHWKVCMLHCRNPLQNHEI